MVLSGLAPRITAASSEVHYEILSKQSGTPGTRIGSISCAKVLIRSFIFCGLLDRLTHRPRRRLGWAWNLGSR